MGARFPSKRRGAGVSVDDAIRVLVVDDEPLYLELASWGLREFGIHVTCAANAMLALVEIQSGQHGPFHLVLTDYQMPGMNGVEFIKRLNGSEPRFPVVIWSNLFSQEVLTEIEELSRRMQIRSLQKSGYIKELSELIRSEVAAWRNRKK